jgi:hypothetical protein
MQGVTLEEEPVFSGQLAVSFHRMATCVMELFYNLMPRNERRTSCQILHQGQLLRKASHS